MGSVSCLATATLALLNCHQKQHTDSSKIVGRGLFNEDKYHTLHITQVVCCPDNSCAVIWAAGPLQVLVIQTLAAEVVIVSVINLCSAV